MRKIDTKTIEKGKSKMIPFCVVFEYVRIQLFERLVILLLIINKRNNYLQLLAARAASKTLILDI